MSKITKPDYTDVWCSAGSKNTPSSLKVQTGWVGEKPPYEYWNWTMNRSDVSAAYSFQMGVPEWDSTVEYQYHANYKSYVQRNGLVYKALQVGTNKDPASEAAYWAVAFDDEGAAAAVQSNLNTHITNYGTLASLSNAATARTNLDVYSKGEGDGRYAALAGNSTQLFLVANGTAGFEAVNKSQLDTKAQTAGSSEQLFSAANGVSGKNVVNFEQLGTKANVNGDNTKAFAVLESTSNDSAVCYSQMMNGAINTSSRLRFPSVWGGAWEMKVGETTESFSETDVTITFPTSFANGCLFVTAIIVNPSSSNTEDIWVQLKSKNSSGAVFKIQGSITISPETRTLQWFAVGY